jgi:hypothetical protein
MRTVAAALVLVGVLGACGDDDDGDGDGDGGTALVSGTVLGQPFGARDGAALRLTEETCLFDTDLGQIQASAAALLVAFGTFENLCGFAQQTAACGDKANATTVNLIVLRANVQGGAAAAIQAGTYPVSLSTPAPDAQGNVTFATALVERTDATCEDTSGEPEATAGSITIESVGPDRVRGSASVTFSEGSSVSGQFDVPLCAFSTDVCTGLGAGCANPVCVP